MATSHDFKQKAKDQPEGTLPSPQEKDKESTRQQMTADAAKAAPRQASGVKYYRIGAQPWFSKDSQLYRPGAIVSIPADEKPSVTWTEVSAKEAQEADDRLTETTEPRAHGRPADQSPI